MRIKRFLVFGMMAILFLSLIKPSTVAAGTWAVTDWSDGSFIESIDIDVSTAPGELVLNNDTSNLILAFDPTNHDVIYTMVSYEGDLYLGACTNPLFVTGGDVIRYDYATNTHGVVYTVWEQGLTRMVARNGKIYIPGIDSEGSWAWGNIYVYDGNTWTRKETVPNAVHTSEIEFHDGKLYVIASVYENEEWDQIIYESADEGDTWSVFLSGNEEIVSGAWGARYGKMTSFNGELYIDRVVVSGGFTQDGVLIYDGETFRSEPLPPTLNANTGGSNFEEFGGLLCYKRSRFVAYRNPDEPLGRSWPWTAFPIVTGNDPDELPYYYYSRGQHSMKAHGDRLFGLSWDLHETGENDMYSTRDLDDWNLECTSPAGKNFKTMESLHGRLYVTAASDVSGGEVYVSASATSGYLLSDNHDFGAPVSSGQIDWNAIVPPGTSVDVQTRSAETEAGLELKDFVSQTKGPLNEVGQWMQYRVYLTTFDPALMPVLEDITITAN